ncbi:MAG: cation acetate symporter [Puniceicoccaceae bacterium TMED149]|nr:MAG: cation acetate symporter [Puniceicoccaceae bacterium TMED149]
MSILTWTYLFVGLSFSLYLFIAWRVRVKDTQGFYLAGRDVPAYANGMATAADWMSAASFISMAGLISTMGYAGSVYLMGWTGGFVLLALCLAPYLRKFGHFTVPEFIGDRYESNPARLIAILCAVFISFTYVAGQMRGVGVVFSRFLNVDISTGVMIGMLIVLIYATLGGMKGITWTQVAQYWVLISAFLIPTIAISIQLTGSAIPFIGMGSTLLESNISGQSVFLLNALDSTLREFGWHSYTEAFQGKWSQFNVFATALTLMVGTAGLPHVIVRFYTVKNVQAARWSAFWALLFISILYLSAPSLASFSRYYTIHTLNGVSSEKLPAWFHSWEKTGLILWLDDGDGIVRYSGDSTNEIFRSGKLSTKEIEAIKAQHALWLTTNSDSGINGRQLMIDKGLNGPDRDIIMLAAPEMAGLSNWIIAFVAAGGLAAALSTASGLLLVISSSIANDLYFRTLNPKASEKNQLLVGRIAIAFAVFVAGYFGLNPPGFVGQVVAFAFGLASASFFPAILLGIFNKRVGTIPAISGLLVGIGITAYYIINCVFFGGSRWTFGFVENGITPEAFGFIGMLLNFTVTLVLTPFFPAPSKSMQATIESVRQPE